MFDPNIVWLEQRRCLRLRERIGLAAVNPLVKALIAQLPDGLIRID
jgi:hypothetical protein